jgi:2-oxoglutarate ferredoxin oxidoreductase subunit alpha
MSEVIVNEAAPTRPQGINQVSQAIIRIAGNSQDGIQALGSFLARLAGRSEQEVMTFMTIPSTISGGPSIFQVRMGSGEVLSAGDEADVLLAFYQHSYEGHVGSLKEGGIVIYDSDHVEPRQEWKERYHHVAVPISGLTVEAIGGTTSNKGKNVYALGLIARMFDLDTAKLEKILGERFGGKDASVLTNALAAFQAGYNYSLGGVLETFRFMDARKKSRHQVVMTGNEAIAYGCLAAGVRFGAGYPITPSTEIMELLRRELPKYGGTFVQCEDEIASMSMILGAGYAGRVGVTTTSGPGLSLKMEAVGWGVMAEIPAVIVDVQRGGPSTGLPTNVEQSDLNIACFGSHGDAPRVVLAPANVRDCFYTALEAVDIACTYHVPVIILSDQAIATRIEAFEEPDLQQVCRQIPLDLTPVPENKPYDHTTPSGISHRALPGTRILNGRYPVAPGLEHDEMGHPTGSPKLHMQMNAKRRRKLQSLAATLPLPEIYGAAEGNLLLVGWGSTHGPIREAVDHSRALGDTVSSIHLRYINPLPPGLDAVFAKFQHIAVVEMNDEGLYGYGQLASLLRARYCDARIRGLNKTDGLTFKVREILEHVRSDVAAGMRHL